MSFPTEVRRCMGGYATESLTNINKEPCAMAAELLWFYKAHDRKPINNNAGSYREPCSPSSRTWSDCYETMASPNVKLHFRDTFQASSSDRAKRHAFAFERLVPPRTDAVFTEFSAGTLCCAGRADRLGRA